MLLTQLVYTEVLPLWIMTLIFTASVVYGGSTRYTLLQRQEENLNPTPSSPQVQLSLMNVKRACSMSDIVLWVLMLTSATFYTLVFVASAAFYDVRWVKNGLGVIRNGLKCANLSIHSAAVAYWRQCMVQTILWVNTLTSDFPFQRQKFQQSCCNTLCS